MRSKIYYAPLEAFTNGSAHFSLSIYLSIYHPLFLYSSFFSLFSSCLHSAFSDAASTDSIRSWLPARASLARYQVNLSGNPRSSPHAALAPMLHARPAKRRNFLILLDDRPLWQTAGRRRSLAFSMRGELKHDVERSNRNF